MMRATDILMQEHRVIERVLTVLEQAVARMESGAAVRPGLFLEAADFIKNFADGCHHHKEEGVLFTAMVNAGVPGHAGPIPVMLAEHEEARRYTQAMREAAERWEGGDDEAPVQVRRAARGYARTLRQHIAKEDGILFPLAGQAIAGNRQAEVLAEFERVEHEDVVAGTHEKYTALAERLEKEMQSWTGGESGS